MLYLGEIYDIEGNLVNHRSLRKVILNPFLRLMGLEIASKYSEEFIFEKHVLVKCAPCINFKGSWLYRINNNIVKRRHLF